MKLVRLLVGLLVVALLSCSGNLCILASKHKGRVLYSSLTVTLLTEALKVLVTGGTLVFTGPSPPPRFVSTETLLYAVPSVL
uniref:Uncharacterized protein n=1 Tax=Peronospora matthiolae TaxID=2874970 RepID=A0AAV1VEF2_9STRA